MYCVKCGVELADSEVRCPLCQTPVYYPEHKRGELLFPKAEKQKEEVTTRGMYFIITILFVIAASISVICDFSLNSKISWSAYVFGALVLVYSIFIMPGWFSHPTPAVFVPTNFVLVAVYIWYISFSLGQDWFFPFALPVIGFVTLVTTTIATLSYYLRCGYLYIWGGSAIATALFMPVLEFLLNVSILKTEGFVWSYYPLVTLFLIGMMLIIIAIVRPFRESLRKIFAI